MAKEFVVGISLLIFSVTTTAMRVEDVEDLAISDHDVALRSTCLNFTHEVIGKILDTCDQTENQFFSASDKLRRMAEIVRRENEENVESLSPAEIFKYVTFFLSIISGLGVILPASLCSALCPHEYESFAMSAFFIGLALGAPCYLGYLALAVYEQCKA